MNAAALPTLVQTGAGHAGPVPMAPVEMTAAGDPVTPALILGATIGASIAVLLEEGYRATVSTTAAPQPTRAARTPTLDCTVVLQRLCRIGGIGLLALGLLFAAAGVGAQLAQALPLHELPAHPRMLPAIGSAVVGLVAILVGRLFYPPRPAEHRPAALA